MKNFEFLKEKNKLNNQRGITLIALILIVNKMSKAFR